MRTTVALALALAAGACKPTLGDAFSASFAAGERALGAGRYDEAAAAFDDAAAKARRVKDRDEARFLQARSLERLERWPEVEATYKRLVADSPTGPRSARAEFEIAEVEIEHGDATRGFALLLAAAHKNPNHGLAHEAVSRLVQRELEAGGDAAVLAWIGRVGPSFAKTDLEEVFAYESGRALERMGRKSEAREVYVATARAHPYPFGGLTDDAFMRAAELDVELGKPAQAIAELRELLAPRESTDTLGSYERPRFSQAQLRIGEIYRDALKDHSSARRELYRLYTDYPTSILRDDALWADARLAHDDGELGDACHLVGILIDKLPQSRYAACAHALCGTAPAVPSDAKHPARECPDYILRELASPPAPAGTERGADRR